MKKPILLFIVIGVVSSNIILLDSSDNNNEAKESADNRVVEEETLLTLEDKKPVLNHLNEDIEEMEDLKKKIEFLEHQLKKHADIHVVDDMDIAIEDEKLATHQKALKQYEDNIVALKNLVTKAKHRFDDESLEDMISIVEKAESFLKKAEQSVEHAEIVDQDWAAEEESKLMKDMFEKDEKNSLNSAEGKPAKLKVNISKDLQNRLILDNWPGYPVGREGRLVIISAGVSDDSKEAMKRKNLKAYKVKNLTKQEKAKVNLIEDVRQRVDEEALADIIKSNSLNEDPVQHYSPELKKALKDAAEASHIFIQEKLVQHPQEADVLPSLLQGLAALSVLFVLVVVLIIRRADRGHRRSPNKMQRGAGSPPLRAAGGKQVPEVHVDPSASAWGSFFAATPGGHKCKQSKLI